MKLNIEEELRIITLRLLLRKPFFGFLVSKMKFIEDKKSYLGDIGTAATDGKNIFYNVEFFQKLSRNERIFVIAHEIMHCVLNSLGRNGSRNPRLWNCATDYVINDYLVLDDIGSLPKVGGLHDIKYRGMIAEEVYDLLLKDVKKEIESFDYHIDPSQIQKTDGDGNTSQAPTQKELEQNLRDFKDSMIEALQRTKIAGNAPGNTELMIQSLIQPKINWKQLLRVTIQSIFKNDIDWKRPNKRNPNRNIILPSMGFDETVDICVSIDTSGSITDQQRVEFLSEICGILKYYKNFKLKIWCFDTQVHAYKEYDSRNIRTLSSYQPAGGGGTHIGCNFDYMKENNIKPKQFVCFTDGFNGSSYWGDPKYCPTTWIIHSNKNPDVPFGKFAHYEELIN